MNTAYLILGGNIGNRLQNLQEAIQLISEKAGGITKTSDIFTTSAWGNTNQADFLNQALCLQTPLTAIDLLETLISIEQILGRVREQEKWTERVIDIDILFYNTDIINTSDLKIPHPYIQERMFVLVPMAQLAPMLVHPALQKNIQTLLLECTDKLEVIKLQTTNG
ncbi:MAG: 2-amino-4-hydroxy-6-hydroxymethyldihydropteridine diphosphokinase [Bacteroidota bacterium]